MFPLKNLARKGLRFKWIDKNTILLDGHYIVQWRNGIVVI